MNKQNLTDYLCGLLTANNPDCLNSFVHVGADEIPDAYLVAINDDLTNDGESEVWTEHSEVDLNNSSNRANEPEDFDEDNSYGDDGVGENDINVIRPAMDVILQERQAVILGNPGSGKTTLLQYVLHWLVAVWIMACERMFRFIYHLRNFLHRSLWRIG